MFEVTPDELSHLGPIKSVELARKMIFSDASVSGIPPSKINVPSQINDSDGGIDGEVIDVNEDSKHGLIKKGRTNYQIKSGKLNINEILLNKNGNLKNRIKTCFENNGTLIIILTDYDKPDRVDDELLNKFYDKLKDKGLDNLKPCIEIWMQNKIINFLKYFFPLICDIKSIPPKLITHKMWSNLPEFNQEYIDGEEQTTYINNIRQQLENWSNDVDIRVIAEPGMGKTRIILEATKTDDISPFVLYFETPERLILNDFSSYLKHDTTNSVILVIDECDEIAYNRIKNDFYSHGSRIKLITIHNEFNDDSPNNASSPPILSNDQIEKILKSYVPKDNIAKWINECEGSPRAAHIIGNNLEQYPQDILKNPNSVQIWERYVANKNSVGSSEAIRRWNVLMWISLFKRFGYKGEYNRHFSYIAKLIEKYRKISLGDFNDDINTLIHMKILQGEMILYITPKILHTKLWVMWQKEFGDVVEIDPNDLFLKNNNRKLDHQSYIFLSWYFDMYRYAKKNETAQFKISKFLEEGGLFDKYMHISQNSIIQKFFLAIAVINPNNSLAFLERFLLKMPHDELLHYYTGRTEIVFALQQIVMKKEYFERAMKLLLTLAETENSTYANNATGIFTGLFSTVYGNNISPTELAPSERFKILQNEFNGSTITRQIIIIKACSVALNESPDIAPIVKYGELDDNVEFWIPKNYDEIINYRITVLEFLESLLSQCDETIRNKIIHILFESSRDLFKNSKTAKLLFSIIKTIHEKKFVDKESIVDFITKELKYNDQLSLDIKNNLITLLNNDVIGNDFSSKLYRYVGMDLIADRADNNYESLFKTRICELIDDSKNYELIKNKLTWLVSSDAKNGYHFGYELCRHDTKFQLLQDILKTYRNMNYDPKSSTCHFLGGYMRKLNEIDHDKCEQILDEIFNDSVLYRIIPELIWRVELNDKFAKKLLTLLNKPDMDYNIFQYFQHGPFGNISNVIFMNWIEKIIEYNTKDSIILAINLLDNQLDYDFNWNLASKELIFNLLTSAYLSDSHYDVMLQHYWINITKRFIIAYPIMCIPIAKHIIDNFPGESIFSINLSSECTIILDDIVSKHPTQLWKLVSKYLIPNSKFLRYIVFWLRGRRYNKKSIFHSFKICDILSWIDEKPIERAPLIANLIPQDFSIAREILIKYSHIENVERYIMINFNNESWSGSGTNHYTMKKEIYKKLCKNESNDIVRKWLLNYIQDIDKNIIRHKGFDEEFQL